jgi:hypothetical protein
MIDTRRRPGPPIVVLVFLALVGLWPRTATAADIGIFVSGAEPGALWGHGFGGFLGISIFNVVGLEIEGAKQNGEAPGSDMWSLSGRAFLAPSFGRFVPYGGLSVGGYHQSLGSSSETGRRSSIFAGVKLKFPLGLVIRGEYEWVDVSHAALLPMDNRFYGGAGISF